MSTINIFLIVFLQSQIKETDNSPCRAQRGVNRNLLVNIQCGTHTVSTRMQFSRDARLNALLLLRILVGDLDFLSRSSQQHVDLSGECIPTRANRVHIAAGRLCF